MNIKEVKRNLQRPVTYKRTGTVYLLTGCVIRRNDRGEFYYQAELAEQNGSRSITICRLEDVEEINVKEEST